MKPNRSPLPGESLDGYLAYRADKMGLPNRQEFAEMVGLGPSCRTRISRSESDFVDLADLLGVPTQTLAELATPSATEWRRRTWHGLSLHVMQIERFKRSFAPEALSRSPHHRMLWDLKPFPFDEQTWELLDHRCPDPMCRRTQGWHHTRGVDRCEECGGNLSGNRGEVVEERHRSALRAALGLIHPDAARRAACATLLPERLRDVDRGDLLDLLVALAGVVDPTIRVRNHFWCVRPTAPAAQVVEAVACAWPLLTGWPNAFEVFALERSAGSAHGVGDGNRGATNRFLRDPSEPGTPTGLGRLIKEESRRLQAAGADDRGIKAGEAAHFRGLRPADISRARKSGQIRGIAALRFGHFIPLLDRSEVEILSKEFIDGRSVLSAATRLGCGRLGVEQLMLMGLLGPRYFNYSIMSSEPRVPEAALTALIAQVEARSTTIEGDRISLAHAFREHGGSLKPVGPVIRAILARDLGVCVAPGPSPLLRRINVDVSDLPKTLSFTFDRSRHVGHDFIAKVSKGEAGGELNLINRAYVALLARWETDGTTPVVPVPWLLETMAACVSNQELSLRTGRSGHFVMRQLVRLGIKEVMPCLYDRATAEQALVEWLDNTPFACGRATN